MTLPQVESMKKIPWSWEIKGAPMPPSPENKADLGIINHHNPLLIKAFLQPYCLGEERYP